MTWTVVGDWVFDIGGFAAAALLAYGAWLSFRAWPQASAIAPNAERRRAAVCSAALGMTSCVLLSHPLPARADAYERGLDAYRQSKYREAVTHFRTAADSGHARAQEILGFMYLHGPGLYRGDVPLDREQAIRWFGRAAQGGSEVAQHMLCVLTGRPAETVVDRASCAARPAGSVQPTSAKGASR